jgi:hypothetical protein
VYMVKKIFTTLILFFFAVVVGWNFPRIFPKQQSPISKSSVTFVFNTGESIATYSGVVADTVYDALTVVSSESAIPLEIKHYDFGVFVNSIGNKSNTKDTVWIYYVNNVSGDVGADKKVVKSGDVVEWRYEKPMY